MIIGCNTVLFARLSLADALRHIRWAGFEAAEIACIHRARHVWPDFGAGEIDETKALFADSRLNIVAMEAATNLLDERNRQWFYSALELAANLDIPLVSTGSGGKSNEEDLERMLAIVPEIVGEAKRHGVKVSIKAHVHAAVHDVASAVQVAKAADSPLVGINYDPTHLYREGEHILTAWDELVPYVVHVHFRDLLGGEDKAIGPPVNQVPGRGVLHLYPLVERIYRSDYSGAVNLEVIGAFDYDGGESLGIAAQSRGFLTRCLEQIKNGDGESS